MSKEIKYSGDSNKGGSILDKNNKQWKTTIGGFEQQPEIVYFDEEAFNKVDKAFNLIPKNNNSIKYMVSNDKDKTSTSNNTTNSVTNYLKKHNNNINLSNSLSSIINSERKTNREYSDKIVSLNGVYKNYISNPKYDKGIYDYIEKLKEQKINISIDRVSYYEKQNGSEKIYLDNGYVISLDNNGYVSCYDYVNNIKYKFEKKDNSYDLKNIILNDENKDIFEINYIDGKTIIKDLTKTQEKDQIIQEDEGKKYVSEIKQINDNTYVYLKGGNIIEIKNNEIYYIDIKKRLSEIAKGEQNNKGSKYREWFYGYDQSTPWCAVFISWLYSQLPGDKKYFSNLDDNGNETKGQDGAGDIPRKSVKGDYIDSNYYGDWYESEYTDPSTEPKEGDIILFNPTIYPYDKYVSRHVGYVYKVDDDNVYTIEGNVGSNDDDQSYVSCKSYNRKDTDINGYYRPNY